MDDFAKKLLTEQIHSDLDEIERLMAELSRRANNVRDALNQLT